MLARIKNTSGSTSPLIVYTRPVPYLPATLDTTQATLTTRTSENMDGTSGPISTIPKLRLGLGRLHHHAFSRHARSHERFA